MYKAFYESQMFRNGRQNTISISTPKTLSCLTQGGIVHLLKTELSKVNAIDTYSIWDNGKSQTSISRYSDETIKKY